MPRFKRLSNLSRRFETSNPRLLAGPWVNDYDRPFALIDRSARRRLDPNQCIVHRSWQLGSLEDDLIVEDQNRVDGSGGHLLLLIAGLPQDVEEQSGALPKISRVVGR